MLRRQQKGENETVSSEYGAFEVSSTLLWNFCLGFKYFKTDNDEGTSNLHAIYQQKKTFIRKKFFLKDTNCFTVLWSIQMEYLNWYITISASIIRKSGHPIILSFFFCLSYLLWLAQLSRKL